MSYYCYTHNWSSRYEQCPSCVTYKTTASNNTEIQPTFQLNIEDKRIAELEAQCKELENKLADSNKDAFDDTKKLYALESENRILKAKLDKALEIIDWSKNWLQNVTLEKKLRTYTPEEHVNYLMKELDSIE